MARFMVVGDLEFTSVYAILNIAVFFVRSKKVRDVQFEISAADASQKFHVRAVFREKQLISTFC